MKAMLTFDLPDEQWEFNRATKATAAFRALWVVSQAVFRPARKHGYAEPRINAAIAAGDCEEAIRLLETRYYEILEECGVDLGEYE